MAANEDPPKKYDQEFFLVLAEKGKDAWNEWRRNPVNKDVQVTFAGVDFSKAPMDRIDFSGLDFGDRADFSGCKWRGVKWEEIEKDREAFKSGRACFVGAAFGWKARLDGAVFGNRASFVRAAFRDRASFTGAAFGDFASFTGAAFGNKASFDNTVFEGDVDFAGTSDDQESKDRVGDADEKGNEAPVAPEKRAKASWIGRGSGPDRFLTISFANARFDGEAIFSGRTFERTANFTKARFYYPPDFDAAANAARIDFTGAHIGFVPPGKRPWTKDSQGLVRLRAFRKIVEETKNHDLERDLYIE